MTSALRIGLLVTIAVGVALAVSRWNELGVPAPPPSATPSAATVPMRDVAGVPAGERTSSPSDGDVVAEPRELAVGTHALDATPPAHANVLVVTAGGRAAAGATVWFSGEVLPPEVRPAELDFGNPMRWVQAHGSSVTADVEGRAMIPRIWSFVCVVAAKDGAIGTIDIGMNEPTPVGGYRIQLVPTRQLRIEVVDAGGAAVPRAPVAYQRSVATPDAEPTAYGLGHTDAAGMLDVFADDDLLAAAARGSVVVTWPRMRLATSRYDAVAGSLRLVLPPGGSIEVAYIDHNGEPVAGRRGVEWHARGGATGAHRAWVTTDADGCLRLPHVPPELSFCVTIDDARVEFAGPTRPGEVVRATLVAGAATTVVRGRVLADGRPVRNTPLFAELGPVPAPEADGLRVPLWPAFALARLGRSVFTSEGGPPEVPHMEYQHPGTVTADDGTFALVVKRTAHELGGVLWLLPAPRSPDCRHAEFAVPADAPPAVELGDLALSDGGLVLSGRIVDDSGRPITHAHIDGDIGRSRGDLRHASFVAADGTFRVYRNRSGAEPVHLSVHAAGCARFSASFPPERRDVRIVMRRQAKLRVEVLVDDEVLLLAEQSQCVLRRDGSQFGSDRLRRCRDRWVVEFDVAPGDVECELQLCCADERLASATLPATAGNLHVRRVDLRGRLFLHVVEARDEAGGPLQADLAVVVQDEQGQPVRRHVGTTDDGVVRVLATRPSVDAVLTATDHAPMRVVAGAAPVRVVMQRLPTLRLGWTGDGYNLPATLEWCDAGGEWRDALAASFVAPAFGAVPLRAVVTRGDGTVFVLPLDPLLVTPGMVQEVRISLAPDQIATLRAAAGG